MTERSVNHANFTVTRRYPASPDKVFGAWADARAKEIWMNDEDLASDGTGYELDFRIGGHERFGGLSPEGRPYRYDGLYYDIVPDRRIVYSYEMYSGSDRTSVSLATVEIEAEGEGARLTYTEQGAFLDGIDKPVEREAGTAWLLDNLGKYLSST